MGVNFREPYTTYEREDDLSLEKDSRFSMSMSVYTGTYFNNLDALGSRMSFILITRGTGRVTINGKTSPYLAPCIFSINEEEHVIVDVAPDGDVRVVLFHPKIINSLLDFQVIRSSMDNIPTTARQDRALLFTFMKERRKYTNYLSLGTYSLKRIESIIDKINYQISNQDNENWPCKCRSQVMELLFMLESLYEADGYEMEEEQTVKPGDDFAPIVSYIYLHYTEKITVEEITEHFHLSRTTMSMLFKKNTGDTFLNFVNKLRIHMASVILRDTDLPVQEIMYRVGFSDSAHFLRMFKRYMGSSPSTYREVNGQYGNKKNILNK